MNLRNARRDGGPWMSEGQHLPKAPCSKPPPKKSQKPLAPLSFKNKGTGLPGQQNLRLLPLSLLDLLKHWE